MGNKRGHIEPPHQHRIYLTLRHHPLLYVQLPYRQPRQAPLCLYCRV